MPEEHFLASVGAMVPTCAGRYGHLQEYCKNRYRNVFLYVKEVPKHARSNICLTLMKV